MDQQEGFRRLRSVAVLGSAAWLLLVFSGAFYVFGAVLKRATALGAEVLYPRKSIGANGFVA